MIIIALFRIAIGQFTGTIYTLIMDTSMNTRNLLSINVGKLPRRGGTLRHRRLEASDE